jgi:hypothetical protein
MALDLELGAEGNIGTAAKHCRHLEMGGRDEPIDMVGPWLYHSRRGRDNSCVGLYVSFFKKLRGASAGVGQMVTTKVRKAVTGSE